MSNRKRPVQRHWTAAITTFFGVTAFVGVAVNPRFETFHVLDIIRLMTAGVAIPVTIMLLIQFFKFAGTQGD